MSRPLPKNLERVYAVIGKESADRMLVGREFTVDGVTFVSGYRPESTADRFFLAKPPDLIDQYLEFLDARDPARVFELGIAEGGSTALLALRPGIEQLVAIDNEEHRLPALDDFIDTRALGDRVAAYFGVDQADASELRQIVARHFSAPIDMVIDDASHDYSLTRASFDCLFPQVAVGGWYMIEDWAQPLKMAETMYRDVVGKGIEPVAQVASVDDPPRMDRLVTELTMAVGAWAGVVDRVIVTDHYVAVRRGPEEVDPDSFSMDQITSAAQVLGMIPSSFTT